MQTETTQGTIGQDEVAHVGVPPALSARQAARRQAVVDAALGLLADREYEQISSPRGRRVGGGGPRRRCTTTSPPRSTSSPKGLVQWAGTLSSDVTRRPLIGTTGAPTGGSSLALGHTPLRTASPAGTLGEPARDLKRSVRPRRPVPPRRGHDGPVSGALVRPSPRPRCSVCPGWLTRCSMLP